MGALRLSSRENAGEERNCQKNRRVSVLTKHGEQKEGFPIKFQYQVCQPIQHIRDRFLLNQRAMFTRDGNQKVQIPTQLLSIFLKHSQKATQRILKLHNRFRHKSEKLFKNRENRSEIGRTKYWLSKSSIARSA
jgi:hypothetical protein